MTFALCILVILLVLVVASFLMPIYGEICNKNEYTQAKERSSHPIVFVVFWHIVKALDAGGVAITALATLAISGFTATLWYSTDAMRKETIRSSTAFKNTQRAYVTSNEVLIEARLSKSGAISSWIVRPVIENSGSTPTKDLRYNFSGVAGPSHDNYVGVVLPVAEEDPDKGFFVATNITKTRLPRLILGAKAKSTIGWMEITTETLQRMFDGEIGRCFINGAIRYRDILDPTVEHVTKFCYVFGAEQLPNG